MSPHLDSLAPPPIDPAGDPIHLHDRATASSTAAVVPAAGPTEAGMLGRKIALAGMSNMASSLVCFSRRAAPKWGDELKRGRTVCRPHLYLTLEEMAKDSLMY